MKPKKRKASKQPTREDLICSAVVRLINARVKFDVEFAILSLIFSSGPQDLSLFRPEDRDEILDIFEDLMDAHHDSKIDESQLRITGTRPVGEGERRTIVDARIAKLYDSIQRAGERAIHTSLDIAKLQMSERGDTLQ
jgi:hypothetical protein